MREYETQKRFPELDPMVLLIYAKAKGEDAHYLGCVMHTWSNPQIVFFSDGLCYAHMV